MEDRQWEEAKSSQEYWFIDLCVHLSNCACLSLLKLFIYKYGLLYHGCRRNNNVRVLSFYLQDSDGDKSEDNLVVDVSNEASCCTKIDNLMFTVALLSMIRSLFPSALSRLAKKFQFIDLFFSFCFPLAALINQFLAAADGCFMCKNFNRFLVLYPKQHCLPDIP